MYSTFDDENIFQVEPPCQANEIRRRRSQQSPLGCSRRPMGSDGEGRGGGAHRRPWPSGRPRAPTPSGWSPPRRSPPSPPHRTPPTPSARSAGQRGTGNGREGDRNMEIMRKETRRNIVPLRTKCWLKNRKIRRMASLWGIYHTVCHSN